MKTAIHFDESFNWLAVLKDLADGMPLEEASFVLLLNKASGWPTCACGQLCRNLPRDGIGRPDDECLASYGADFYKMVQDKEWRKAITLFHLIEQRTDQLLHGHEQQHLLVS